MYLGGFAPMGGIESYARDFFVETAQAFPNRHLVYWGRKSNQLPLVLEIIKSGARVTRTSMRWGCSWGIPDRVLYFLSTSALKSSGVVVFQKPPPVKILTAMRRIRRSDGSRPKFVLITPYRPLEYWSKSFSLFPFEMIDAFVVQSDDWKNDLAEFGYKGFVETIPYFPPPVHPVVAFPFVSDHATVRIGFLGRLEPDKNLPYLLEAFKLLSSADHFCYQLHFFGDGSGRAPLMGLAGKLCPANVYFHGSIDHCEVNHVIDSCDIFASTSLTEGQCLTAFEILSRGRPIVATPVGAFPDVLSNPRLGRIVNLNNPGRLAAAIHQSALDIRDGIFTPESIQHAFLLRYCRERVRDQHVSFLKYLMGCNGRLRQTPGFQSAVKL